MSKHAIYMRFSSETNFESLRFNSHIITYEDIKCHLQEKKNIKVAPDKDQIELIDALRKTKYGEKDSIDPGARIIIYRYPGTKHGEIVVKSNTASSLPSIGSKIEGKPHKEAEEEDKTQNLDLIDQNNQPEKAIEEEVKVEKKKIMQLKYTIPKTVLKNRKRIENNRIIDSSHSAPVIEQLPSELLCNECKNLLTKPYIFS